MLQFDLTKRHAGIVLWGDTWSLRAVHDLVPKVNEESPVVTHKESLLLGLAYDVRKAYEGQREKAVRSGLKTGVLFTACRYSGLRSSRRLRR